MQPGRTGAAKGRHQPPVSHRREPSAQSRRVHRSPQVEEVLADLSARADIVLIDSAPMLGIGDALALTAKVDGLILVARLNLLRRPMLRELDRALHAARRSRWESWSRMWPPPTPTATRMGMSTPRTNGVRRKASPAEQRRDRALVVSARGARHRDRDPPGDAADAWQDEAPRSRTSRRRGWMARRALLGRR